MIIMMMLMTTITITTMMIHHMSGMFKITGNSTAPQLVQAKIKYNIMHITGPLWGEGPVMMRKAFPCYDATVFVYDLGALQKFLRALKSKRSYIFIFV